MLRNLGKMVYLRCYKIDLLLRPLLLSGIQISYAGEGLIAVKLAFTLS